MEFQRRNDTEKISVTKMVAALRLGACVTNTHVTCLVRPGFRAVLPQEDRRDRGKPISSFDNNGHGIGDESGPPDNSLLGATFLGSKSKEKDAVFTSSGKTVIFQGYGDCCCCCAATRCN